MNTAGEERYSSLWNSGTNSVTLAADHLFGSWRSAPANTPPTIATVPAQSVIGGAWLNVAGLEATITAYVSAHNAAPKPPSLRSAINGGPHLLEPNTSERYSIRRRSSY